MSHMCDAILNFRYLIYYKENLTQKIILMLSKKI